MSREMSMSADFPSVDELDGALFTPEQPAVVRGYPAVGVVATVEGDQLSARTQWNARRMGTAFLQTPEAAALTARGHRFGAAAEIGAATGIEFLKGNRVLVAAEPVRRGGGSALVVKPTD